MVLLVAMLFIRRKRKLLAQQPINFLSISGKITREIALNSKFAMPIEISRSKVEIGSMIGEGNFGEVYRAILTSTISSSKNTPIAKSIVAVKSIITEEGTEKSVAKDMMLSEAALMAQFQHPNIVRLIGVVTVGEPMYIILEFCDNGSMEAYLHKNVVEIPLQIRFAKECAEGMTYLTSLLFIHRDIASRNILIDLNLTCKIADFGMSRAKIDKEYYRSRGGPLPVRWTAPEALESLKFSEQSDVWSFGVLLWEIWSRAMVPYEKWSNDKVWAKVLAGYRLQCPIGCPAEVYNLMLTCWDKDGDKRPSFSSILDTLYVFDKQLGTSTAKKTHYLLRMRK